MVSRTVQNYPPLALSPSNSYGEGLVRKIISIYISHRFCVGTQVRKVCGLLVVYINNNNSSMRYRYIYKKLWVITHA